MTARKTVAGNAAHKKKRPPAHSRSVNAELQHRENQALKFRLAGFDYRSIGAQLVPPCQGPGAYKMVQRALARDRAEVVEDVRDLEVRRVDYLTRRPFTAAIDKNTPLALALKATDTVNALSASRRRLLGLDSPLEIKLGQAIQAYEQDVLDVIRPLVTAETFDRITAALARLGGVGGPREGEGPEGASPTQH